MRAPVVLVVVLLFALVLPCGAAVPEGTPSDLAVVHLDTPVVLAKGACAVRADVRVFGGDEDLTYTNLGVHYGLGGSLEAIVRGAFAARESFGLPPGGGVIRHGGSDVEIAAKYGFTTTSPTALLVGVSFADTPAQSDGFLTVGLAASSDLGHGVTAYIDPRWLAIRDNNIVGLGFGVRARLSDTVALVADYTPVVHGNNTLDTTSGEPKRSDVYGVALRFGSPGGNWSLDLGYANGTGTTTGFALTPGLGGSGAFYAAVSFRR